MNCVCLRHKDLHLIKVFVKSLPTIEANLQCAETFTQTPQKIEICNIFVELSKVKSVNLSRYDISLLENW